MIRQATEQDIPAMLGLGRQMHAEGYFRHVAMDDNKVEVALRSCLAQGFLWVNDGPDGVDGGLAGYITEFWFSRETVAADLAFFVRPNRRGSISAVRLVQQFVAWAKDNGAAEVSISQSSGVRLEETSRLFTGMGFTYVGGIFKWRFS